MASNDTWLQKLVAELCASNNPDTRSERLLAIKDLCDEMLAEEQAEFDRIAAAESLAANPYNPSNPKQKDL